MERQVQFGVFSPSVNRADGLSLLAKMVDAEVFVTVYRRGDKMALGIVHERWPGHLLAVGHGERPFWGLLVILRTAVVSKAFLGTLAGKASGN